MISFKPAPGVSYPEVFDCAAVCLQVLLDRVFEGLFRQLQGTGWQRVLPGLIFEVR